MGIERHLQRWSGAALRHIPAGSSFGVLDFRYAGRSADNRWNHQGSPTLYLAGDEGVLIAEWGRHFTAQRTPELPRLTVERQVFRLELSLAAVIDLRSPAVCTELSLANAPYCFTDVNIARATAQFVRMTSPAQAVLVPSLGFLDDPARWCLVVFLEKLPADPESFITAVTACESVRWG
ncbi:MAG: RES family NAD+ phosphorylase [Thermomicrobiales bacterium]